MSYYNLTRRIIPLFVILQFLTLSNSQEQEPELLRATNEQFKNKHVFKPTKVAADYIRAYPRLPPIVISVLQEEPKQDEYTKIPSTTDTYISNAAINFESFYTKQVKGEKQYRCLAYNMKIKISFVDAKPVHFASKVKPTDFRKANYKSNCNFLKNKLAIPGTYYEKSAGADIIEEQASIGSSSFNTIDGADLLINGTIAKGNSSETIISAM